MRRIEPPPAGGGPSDPWNEPVARSRGPSHDPRRPVFARRRRERTVAVVIAVGAVVALLVFTVPVPQTDYEWFAIRDPGTAGLAFGQHQVFPDSGTFSFTWSTSTIAGANLTVFDPSGRFVYGTVNDTGGATFHVRGGAPYLFEVVTPVAEVVTVSGSLSFSAPML